MRLYDRNILGALRNAIGKGLLAGLAGKAAMTISQMIEMRITKRKPSEAPIKVAEQVTDVKETAEKTKTKVSQEIHWAYGTSWGVAPGTDRLRGLTGFARSRSAFCGYLGNCIGDVASL
jgi:hypothetical protein